MSLLICLLVLYLIAADLVNARERVEEVLKRVIDIARIHHHQMEENTVSENVCKCGVVLQTNVHRELQIFGKILHRKLFFFLLNNRVFENLETSSAPCSTTILSTYRTLKRTSSGFRNTAAVSICRLFNVI